MVRVRARRFLYAQPCVRPSLPSRRMTVRATRAARRILFVGCTQVLMQALKLGLQPMKPVFAHKVVDA